MVHRKLFRPAFSEPKEQQQYAPQRSHNNLLRNRPAPAKSPLRRNRRTRRVFIS